MKQSIWNKRFPTLIGLLVIGIGIGALTFLSQHRMLFFSQASPSENPKNVQISNITDSSFTITYITDANVIGAVSYGVDKNIPQVALDDRDQLNGTSTFHTTHSITIKQLKPKTAYYFAIKSGGNTYLNNNSLYQASTAENTNSPPSQEKPITGKIVSETGQSPADVLVFAKTADSQLISTPVQPTGFFLLPLNSLRDSSLASFLSLPDGTQININVVSASGNSQTTFSLGQDNSVPAITLSQNYDFTKNTATIPAASSSGQPVSFSSIQSSIAAQITPAILSPKNNENLIDQQPEFTGTAPPGTQVNIEIHSAPVISQVTSASNGFWSFRPSVPLSVGLHTIIVTFKDASEFLQTIQQSFTVYATGSQVDQSATPSATPIITVTPTLTITPSPVSGTINPTQTSTVTITPTGIPTEQPTSLISSPTPTLLTFVTGNQTTGGLTQPAKLVTGDSVSPWFGFLGIATVITGMVLFFATQSSAL